MDLFAIFLDQLDLLILFLYLFVLLLDLSVLALVKLSKKFVILLMEFWLIGWLFNISQ
jgi:hypothetical protein